MYESTLPPEVIDVDDDSDEVPKNYKNNESISIHDVHDEDDDDDSGDDNNDCDKNHIDGGARSSSMTIEERIESSSLFSSNI